MLTQRFSALLVVALTLLLAGCGEERSSFARMQKEAEKTSLFRAIDEGEGDPTVVPLPVENVCSNRHTRSVGTNLMRSSGAQLRVYRLRSEGAEHVVASELPVEADRAQLRQQLVNRRRVGFSTRDLEPGTYTFLICPEGAGSSCTLPPGTRIRQGRASVPSESARALGPIEAGSLVAITKEPDGSAFSFRAGSDPSLRVYLAAPTFRLLLDENPIDDREGDSERNEDCDRYESPLVIDTRSEIASAHVRLSAPLDGVRFDIVGDGRPRRISWVVDPEKDRFLALPDSSGAIPSVHQLFGNNTIGPDGRTASNGFEALRKHDLNRDRVIDPLDPVFQRLRLWADLDRNGSVGNGELTGLAGQGVAAISLRYTTKVEEDEFGNQTRQRSTLRTSSGAGRMIFDLWFRPLP